MTSKTAILWFRQDLRLTDNPALTAAVDQGYKIIPIYILDDENAEEWKIGGAGRWWLHQSLNALNQPLENKIIFKKGAAEHILETLIEECGAEAVFWNRCYEPWRIKRDKHIKQSLKDKDITVETFNASLLWEPWEVLKNDGTPYRVFTPFYRKGCLKTRDPEKPLPKPQKIDFAEHNLGTGTLEDLNLMPKIEWYTTMEKAWVPGEQGAQDRLTHFLENGLKGYKEDRNRPDLDNVSRLSPYLHWGEISPRQVWHAASEKGLGQGWEKDTDHFCSELGWREFSYYLLYHFPQITWENLQEKFNDFPWISERTSNLTAWEKGQTGIPIVDAGMRQLYAEGWMHNRVRMIVGSLLVKNLLIHWHKGEEWFWDTLVDADLASNSASWQWVAGSGADAAPYFRIFNPITQGQKFDPEGNYVRKYVPELKDMPKEFIHTPWEAGPLITKAANVKLGENYPMPIVGLKESRQKALDAFQTTKK